jgi:hypothetical protein
MRTLSLLLALCAVPWFYCQAARVDSDFVTHINWAVEGNPPAYPLFHWCVQLLNRCRVDSRLAAAIVAASAVGWSAWIVSRHIATPGPMRGLICVLLAVAYPLPTWWSGQDVYSWTVSPNFWHNPTATVAMPFALLLFFAATKPTRPVPWKDAAAVSVLAVLSLLAKPSYFLAFVPALGVYLAAAWRHAGKVALALVPAAAVLGWQCQQAAGGVVWAPFYLWSKVCPNIPAAIAASLMFPMVVVILYFREANRDNALILAWCCELIAVAEFSTLLEMNYRWDAGNVGWGMLLSAHVLFAVSAVFVSRQPPGWRRPVCLGVLALQGVSGLAYLSYFTSASA